MKHLSEKVLGEYKDKLLLVKSELLNSAQEARNNLHIQDTGGDEADQSNRIFSERQNLYAQDRLRSRLFEIEMALSRIEIGTYGICEETEEPINKRRLMAIPWTRYCVEGAERRENHPHNVSCID